MKRILILLACCLLGPLSMQAEEYYQPLKSYRAIAMGNTGVATANDAYSLSYNPAVLANVRGWWLDIAAWTVEASAGVGALDAAPSILDIQYPYLNEGGLSELSRSSFLEKTDPHMRANAGINFAANITQTGLAVGANYLREVVIQGQDDNTVIFQRNDRITQYGVSLPLFSGRLILGLGTRKIDRRDATSDATTGVPSFGTYEKGQANDLGLLWRLGGGARITVGLVKQNIGGMDIGTTLDAEPEETHFGINMDLELGPIRLVPTIDIRGIQSTRARQNRVHAGVEFGLLPNDTGGNFISVRAGLNEGHATRGAELNFFSRSLVMGAAQYTEEIGDEVTSVPSELRTLLYFSLGF